MLISLINRLDLVQNFPLILTVFPLQFAKGFIVLSPMILIFRNKMVSLTNFIIYYFLLFSFAQLLDTNLGKAFEKINNMFNGITILGVIFCHDLISNILILSKNKKK